MRIRGLLNDLPSLRHEVLAGDHRVPMVFQYNPVMHYLETNDRDELLVTLNHSRVVSPRVRYNIGDEARLTTRRELLARLKALGHDPTGPRGETIDLPYLLLFGRRDQTISIMGANIYAEDVERVVYAQPELSCGFASFILCVAEDDHTVHPRLSVEWHDDRPPSLPLAELGERIRHDLAEINADFRQSLSEDADALRFEVAVFGLGQGPFGGATRRIKNRYLEKGAFVTRRWRRWIAPAVLVALPACSALFGGHSKSADARSARFRVFPQRKLRLAASDGSSVRARGGGDRALSGAVGRRPRPLLREVWDRVAARSSDRAPGRIRARP